VEGVKVVTVSDVHARKLVWAVKEELKSVKEIKPPVWSVYAKSGVNRQRPPEQPDFWYIRGASLLRRIYLDGPVGVEKLRTFYGGRKRRRTKPARFRKGSGSVVRKLLQQLETAGFVEKEKSGSGRKITPKGRKFLDNIANKAAK
jgi:small subunit ribosomal protein S19e